MELASGRGIGTIAGIGGSVTNFARLMIDHGAAWNIAGNATGLGAIGTIAGFTFNDTIDLTGFVAVSETFNSGTLVLTDSAKATATLNIEGTFTSGDFQITSDNIDGTDITIPQTIAWIGASNDWNTSRRLEHEVGSERGGYRCHCRRREASRSAWRPAKALSSLM